MTDFVLVHGAGSAPSYWYLVAPELRRQGHQVLTPELPCDDETAGLGDYGDAIADSIGNRRDVVLVAQSFGAFSAPLVCDRVAVQQIILVAPMIPLPGESAGDWWAATGWEKARRYHADDTGQPVVAMDDIENLFLHDVPPESAIRAQTRRQASKPFTEPWPLLQWPDVATAVIACSQDRLFPLPFMRRVARERLGVAASALESGHLPALARPVKLVEHMLAILPFANRTCAAPA